MSPRSLRDHWRTQVGQALAEEVVARLFYHIQVARLTNEDRTQALVIRRWMTPEAAVMPVAALLNGSAAAGMPSTSMGG